MTTEVTTGGAVRLSKHGKFRMEHDHVLLCHCRYLQDFEVPIAMWDVLCRLRAPEGVPVAALKELSTREQGLVSDLRKLCLLDEVGDNAVNPPLPLDREAAAAVWQRIGYQEDM
jgi:hypothetical protein